MYDEETGLYYLRSRYYNATRCRFINADIFVTTGNELLSTNNYTYCKNKIINHIDENGQADRTISQEDDYLTKALSYLLLNIESRTENSTSQKILEIPGIITFTHKETIGWTSNSDGKGVYPVIGISNEGVINGYSIYGENVFSGITHGDNNLSVELGADNVSLGITLGLGWSWFGPTLDISLDYTVYDGKGQYVRTTYTASVGIIGTLLIAAAIIAAPGLATVLPATAPALLAFAT